MGFELGETPNELDRLREELRQAYEALEDVKNYFWGTEPPILKESDVQESVEAVLKNRSRG